MVLGAGPALAHISAQPLKLHLVVPAPHPVGVRVRPARRPPRVVARIRHDLLSAFVQPPLQPPLHTRVRRFLRWRAGRRGLARLPPAGAVHVSVRCSGVCGIGNVKESGLEGKGTGEGVGNAFGKRRKREKTQEIASVWFSLGPAPRSPSRIFFWHGSRPLQTVGSLRRGRVR